MRKKYDLVGLGAVLVDNMAVLPFYPESDTKIEILRTQKQLGGPVPTALRAASNFGLKTSFIGKVGDDEHADFIKNTLFESDVSIANMVSESNSKSGYAQVWIDSRTGNRTIAYSSGTICQLSAEEIDFDKLPDAKFFHLDGRNHDEIKEIIEFYKKRGTYITIDTGVFREKTLRTMQYADIIIMPKSFAMGFISGENMQSLVLQVKELYPAAKIVIMTDGKNGSVCCFRDKIFVQKAFETDVVDTTGSGDIHSAGILFGLCNNWKIEDTLEFAAAAAAIKCGFLGNLKLPDIQEIKRFLKEQRTCNVLDVI